MNKGKRQIHSTVPTGTVQRIQQNHEAIEILTPITPMPVPNPINTDQPTLNRRQTIAKNIRIGKNKHIPIEVKQKYTITKIIST